MVFKTLASIGAWVLFIFGALSLLGGFIRIFSLARFDLISAYLGFGVVSLFLSVVAMRMRQKMD